MFNRDISENLLISTFLPLFRFALFSVYYYRPYLATLSSVKLVLALYILVKFNFSC